MQHCRWGYGAWNASNRIASRESKLLLISTNYPDHPATQTKKDSTGSLSTTPKHSKKIIDILSSWWTTQIVVLAHPKPLHIYQSINNQSDQPAINLPLSLLAQASASALRSSTEPVSVAPAMPTMAITCPRVSKFRPTAPSYVSSRDIEIYLHWKDKKNEELTSSLMQSWVFLLKNCLND